MITPMELTEWQKNFGNYLPPRVVEAFNQMTAVEKDIFSLLRMKEVILESGREDETAAITLSEIIGRTGAAVAKYHKLNEVN